ncbi:MAG: winged helix-turn-helix domain-containing protein [Planctomycetota bacterium]
MAVRHQKLETLVRGFANHHRISILERIVKKPGMSVAAVAKAERMNLKTCSEHLRRLTVAGLIEKEADGRRVEHTPTPRGKKVVKFLTQLT